MVFIRKDFHFNSETTNQTFPNADLSCNLSQHYLFKSALAVAYCSSTLPVSLNVIAPTENCEAEAFNHKSCSNMYISTKSGQTLLLLTMCLAGKTPSTIAQQKAATTPKLMKTIDATNCGRKR